MTVEVNQKALEHAKYLIDEGKYAIKSRKTFTFAP